MMITSRGCPFDCSFCFKVERAYRFRSVDMVMAEFDVLKSRGVRAIHIMDDAFTANKKRCFAIADALIEGKYRFRLKVRSRVNVVDEELLRKLKACGVRQVVYGIESGSQKVLDSMNKRTTVELNERVIKLTNKVGIFCTADIMIGMPAETPETLEETRQFLKRNRLIISSIPFLYFLPGTKVYADMKASGQMQGDWTLDGNVPWVKLGWTDSVADLYRASNDLARVVHRDPGAIAHLVRHNPGMLSPRSLWQRRRELARWVFS
jgi:radical SAM superfamily enzyme YgiQ (UPF0313 family)